MNAPRNPNSKLSRLLGLALLLVSMVTGFAQPSTNYVLSFDGGNGVLTIPSAADLQNPTALTIEAWLYPYFPGGFVAKGDGIETDTSRSYNLGWRTNSGGGVLAVELFLNTNTWGLLEVSMPGTNWVHVAATYSSASGHLRLYTNGVLAAFTTNSSMSLAGAVVGPLAGQLLRQTTLPVNLGGQIDHLGRPSSWAGYLDEVRIWAVARSPQEILANVHQRLTGSEAGLSGYWNFDTGTPSDITGHGHNGTLVGTTTITPIPGGDIIHNQTPRGALGTAQVVNGFVVGVALTDSGWGYTNVPPVHFLGGGGSGAAGVATIQNGVVTGVTITATGSGYTSVPRVLIAAPPGLPSLRITVKQVLVNLNLILGYTYKLQTSTDLLTWTDAGTPFLATESTMSRTFDVTGSQQVFRVIQVP